MMTYKDQRILLMSELLKGIKIIKFFVWENFFLMTIGGINAFINAAHIIRLIMSQ